MPERKPDLKTLDFLIEKANEIDVYSMRIRGSKDGVVTRHAVHETVKRYRDYIAEQDYIDRTFRICDTDHSGELEGEELEMLLRKLSPGSTELLSNGVSFILDECDLNHNGSIDREELLPMIGTWLALAKKR